VFELGYPEKGFYWNYPGVYSIFVPYGWTNDFFFSGHLGNCAITFAHVWDKGEGTWWRKYFSWWVVLVGCTQAFLMLVTRSHYTIDMTTGIMTGHYIYLLVGKLIAPLDNMLYYKDKPLSTTDEEEISMITN